ncbi:MAG: hypothetical protein ACR2KQ_11365 [Actinomycetota bacterium]
MLLRFVGRPLLSLLIILAACSPDSSESPPRNGMRTTQLSESVRIDMEFSDEPASVRSVAAIGFGESRGELGYRGICTEAACRPPCPCTVPIQPISFAIAEGGRRIFILDPLNSRIAMYAGSGSYEGELDLSGIGLRSLDLQISSDLLAVLFQPLDLSTAFFVLREPIAEVNAREVSVMFAGRSPSSSSTFQLEDGVAYLSLFVEKRVRSSTYDEEVLVGVPLLEGQKAVADEVPGYPTDDGHVSIELVRRPPLISIVSEDWKRTLDLRAHSIDGVLDDAVFSWEAGVEDTGAVHLLIRAHSERARRGGYFYVSVDSEGRVSEPLRILGPKGRDDGQTRHFAVDEDGTRYFMWRRSQGIVIESIS